MKSIADTRENQEGGHQVRRALSTFLKTLRLSIWKNWNVQDTIPALTGTENFFKKEITCDSDEFLEENKPEREIESNSGKGSESLRTADPETSLRGPKRELNSMATASWASHCQVLLLSAVSTTRSLAAHM